MPILIHFALIALCLIYCLLHIYRALNEQLRSKPGIAERSARPTRINSKFKRHLARHWVAWISLVISTLLSLSLAYSEVDIRGVPNPAIRRGPSAPGIKEKSGDCFYHFSFKQKFKNESFRGGHIDKVDFIPVSLDVKAVFNLTSIEKIKLGWREEREIEINYSASLDKTICLKRKRGEPLMYKIRFYDNTGKIISGAKDTPFEVMMILP